LKGEQVTEKPNVTLPGKVEKIIDPARPSKPEKAEISIEGADTLYQEIRIENTLTDKQGNEVRPRWILRLKPKRTRPLLKAIKKMIPEPAANRLGFGGANDVASLWALPRSPLPFEFGTNWTGLSSFVASLAGSLARGFPTSGSGLCHGGFC
jgi:hypothetical protein